MVVITQAARWEAEAANAEGRVEEAAAELAAAKEAVEVELAEGGRLREALAAAESTAVSELSTTY